MNISKKFSDPLSRIIVGLAALLGALHIGLFFFRESEPLLAEIPMFVPMIHGFVALEACTIAFLALGSHRALRDPILYWIGIAFASISIFNIFYVLTWPGLRSDGQPVIGLLSGTAAWIIGIGQLFFSVLLIVGVSVRWPGKHALERRNWAGSVAGWFVLFILVNVSFIAFERNLPPMIGPNGTFTLLMLVLAAVTAILYATGAVAFTRYYLRSHDMLSGYVALDLVLLSYGLLGIVMTTKRYALMWYTSRLLAIVGGMIVLFGLLWAYVRLYQKEQAKSRELEANIAVRKQAEEELKESEARLKRSQAMAHLASWELDVANDVLTWSDEVYRIFGLEPQEFKATYSAFLEAVHPDDRKAVNEAYSGSLRERKDSYEIEHRVVRKSNGEVRMVHEKCEHIRDQSGRIVRSVGMVHDITDRKRHEQEKELTIEFLHLVNESRGSADLIRAATTFFQQRSGCDAVGIRLRDGDDYPYFEARGFPEEFILLENHLCDYDEDGHVRRDEAGNPVLECMCGNVICGRFDASKAFFTARGSFWTNSTTEFLAGATEQDRQAGTRNRCNRDGYESLALIALRSGDETSGLLQLNDKRKGCFTSQSISLWERLGQHLSVAVAKFKAEEALRAAKDSLEVRVKERTAELETAKEAVTGERQRLYGVLETLPVYVCLLDSEYYMPFANRYFRETFGESGGRRCHDFLFNRTEPCDVCETYTVMKTRAPHHWYWTSPNGRDYDIYDFPFTDTDGSFLILEMGIDITERKQAEDALNQTLADLTRSNADLEKFAYVASHDLQEPLRNVAGCLQLLEQKYKNNLDAQADQYIGYAIEGAVRMKALVQDLLAYSRIGTRGRPLQQVDCQQILSRTIANLRPAIADAGAVIAHDPLPTVLADDTQLLQVFQNLIQNAIKFRQDEPPQVHVSAVKNDDEWVFSVRDNGIGIESRYFDRIFEIFQRLNKRERYDGTGMGLAIVKKVLERHRGRVWVESEPDKGTTFYFTIPKKGIPT